MGTSNKVLALFDFDGTLSSGDSLVLFLRYIYGDRLFYLGVLNCVPTLIAWRMRLLSNGVAKETLLKWFLEGVRVSDIIEKAECFSKNKLMRHLKVAAVDRLKWHQRLGHEVVVVSASAELWLNGLCNALDVKLIATQLEVVDGVYSGRFEGKNCNGDEKVLRVQSCYNTSEYAEIYAYGDSKEDLPMLMLATHPFYRKF